MRYPILLGPFHPGWPGILRLALDVEDGVVQTAAAEVLAPKPLRSEEWAGLHPEEGLARVERLCAASSWAYTLAYCQALESLAGLEVPPRARFLRVMLAELERVASHLLTASKVLSVAGVVPVALALLNLREQVLLHRQKLTGQRFFSSLNVPGGLSRNVEDLAIVPLIDRIKGPLYRLSHRVISSRTAIGPLIGAGLVTKEYAEEQGVGGPVARAAESPRDLRRDQPYAAYGQLDAQMVTQGGGDVFARWMVLILETFESLRLLEAVAGNLPAGPVRAAGAGSFPAGEAQSRVEAAAGPLVVRVQVDESGHLAGLWRNPASQVHLAVLPPTLPGQRLDLVGVIVASWGLCSPCLAR
jgi:ech hydrogenase subunit E